MFKDTLVKAVELDVRDVPPFYKVKVKTISTLFLCVFPTTAGAEEKIYFRNG